MLQQPRLEEAFLATQLVAPKVQTRQFAPRPFEEALCALKRDPVLSQVQALQPLPAGLREEDDSLIANIIVVEIQVGEILPVG